MTCFKLVLLMILALMQVKKKKIQRILLCEWLQSEVRAAQALTQPFSPNEMNRNTLWLRHIELIFTGERPQSKAAVHNWTKAENAALFPPKD